MLMVVAVAAATAAAAVADAAAVVVTVVVIAATVYCCCCCVQLFADKVILTYILYTILELRKIAFCVSLEFCDYMIIETHILDTE